MSRDLELSDQQTPENTNVTRAAGVVGTATFLSRIFGYIRDMVFAWFFGAGLYSDAFIAAFRIPNMLRRLFGEGSLSIAFIPVFTEYFTTRGKEEAFRMARSAIRLLSLLLTIAAVLGVLLSPLIVKVIAYGFTDSPEKFSLTVTLTRIMFPYIILICLVALCMGILNVLGHFAAPALAPVLLNIAMIGSMFFVSLLSSSNTDRVIGLAVGVLIGGLLQIGLQAPFLIRKGFYFWHKAKLYHPGLKKVGLLMLPAIFGSAVYQVNTLVITLLASLLPEGSITYLYYADRLVQLPHGIFGLAIATAVMPSLSRQAAEKDFEALRGTFAHAMKLVLFITIPSLVGLIVLREPIIALLFKRGAFGAQATRLTAYALLYYSIGLWAFSGVRIVVATFYALQDTKTPVQTAIISIIANIVLGILLMVPMGHGGLALALSLSSMLNLGLLVRALRVRLGSLGWKSIAESACKTIICSAIMGAVVWSVALLIVPAKYETLSSLFFGLMGSIAAGLVFYSSFSFLTKSRELDRVLIIIREGITRR